MKTILRTLLVALSAAAAVASASCTIGTPIADHPCPQGGLASTYETFGRDFFNGYCVRCHGGPNGYSSRSFTSLDAIRADKDRIFINAAADNKSMPPGPDGPSQHERDMLADWLACGAP